jgi:hypothetical protein
MSRISIISIFMLSLTTCQTAPKASDSSRAIKGVTVEEGPRLPQGSGSHSGGVVDQHIVVVGGELWNADRTVKSYLNETLVIRDGKWTADTKLPIPLAESAYASDGNSLYLAGGVKGKQKEDETDNVYKLSWRDDHVQIEQLTSLPTTISGPVGEILNGNLYVACGYVNGAESSRMYCLNLSDPAAGWKELAPLPAAGRGFPALAACGDYLYLMGGLGGNEGDSNDTVHQRTLSDIYRYDPKSNTWTVLGNLPVGGYCWNASAIDSTHLLLAGRADGVMHDDIWIVGVSPLSAQLVGHCVVAADCAPLIRVNDNTWWLVGGEPDMNKHRTDRVSVISLKY